MKLPFNSSDTNLLWILLSFVSCYQESVFLITGRVYLWTQVTAQELMLHWTVITTSLFLRDVRLKFLHLKNLHAFPWFTWCSQMFPSTEIWRGKKIWTAARNAVTSAVTHIPQPSHWQHPSGRSSYSPHISELSALAKYVKPLLTDLMQMLSQC